MVHARQIGRYHTVRTYLLACLPTYSHCCSKSMYEYLLKVGSTFRTYLYIPKYVCTYYDTKTMYCTYVHRGSPSPRRPAGAKAPQAKLQTQSNIKHSHKHPHLCSFAPRFLTYGTGRYLSFNSLSKIKSFINTECQNEIHFQ